MKDKKYIVNILSKISQNEIKQIRKIYKNKRALDDYVFNFSKISTSLIASNNLLDTFLFK